MAEANKKLAIAKEEATKARAEGSKESKTEIVKNLLHTGKFSIAEIADYANVSKTFVKDVKRNLKGDF